MPEIKASVGKYAGGTKECYNVPADQLIVIKLLNKISVQDGGTAGKLSEDINRIRYGVVSQELYKAIQTFQTTQTGGMDGHVDPRGRTIKRLNELGGLPSPGPQPQLVQVIPFHEPSPFLISKQAHSLSKSDLKSTPTPTSVLPLVASTAVKLARFQSTTDLENLMVQELAVPDAFLSKPIGVGQARFFFRNTVPSSTNTHGVGSALSDVVKGSPEFKAAHSGVKDAITKVVQATALTGIIDYQELAEPKKKVPPPKLGFFGFQPLHVLIGSFQGVNVFLNDFTADPVKLTYSAELTYEFFDHFGADDSDTVADFSGHGSPGQIALWILQRERHPGHMPFITDVLINESIVDERF